MELNKYDITFTQTTKPVYEKRYKNNGEEYLKKVDEIDIKEDLKEKELEINRLKEIFDTQERAKESELIDEWTDETKQKELALMQEYTNLDTYEFLNKSIEIQNLYNRMPEEIRKNYKNLSKFTKEYLPEFAKKTRENLEKKQQFEKMQNKQEVKTQTKQELEEQINVLQEKLKGVTNENV